MTSQSIVGSHLGLGRDQANSEPTRLLWRNKAMNFSLHYNTEYLKKCNT